MHRYAISEDAFNRIKDLLPGKPGRHAKDNRLFIDAVLWIQMDRAHGRSLARALLGKT